MSSSPGNENAGPARSVPAVIVFRRRALALFAAAGIALLLTSARAELSPDALQDLDRGLAAANRQEWNVAIGEFMAAYRHPGPRWERSVIMLNLGLAHANAGHHLTAIAWLQAHLVAEPDTAGAAAVEEQIERLERRVNDTIGTLYVHAIAQAKLLAKESQEKATLRMLARSLARSGYMTRAVRILGELGEKDPVKDAADRLACEKGFLDYQYARGAVAVLAMGIDQVQPAGLDHDDALCDYIERFCNHGRFSAARKLAALLSLPALKDRWLRFLNAPGEESNYPGKTLDRTLLLGYERFFARTNLDTAVDPVERKERAIWAWTGLAEFVAGDRRESDLPGVIRDPTRPFREPVRAPDWDTKGPGPALAGPVANAKVTGPPAPPQHIFTSTEIPGRTMLLAEFLQRQLEQMLNLRVSLEEHSAAFANEVGLVRSRAGDRAGAIAAYNQALALNPSFCAWLYHNRAYNQYHAGNYGTAVADYTRVVLLDPGNVDAFQSRAVAKKMLSDWRGAVADYGRAIALKPDAAELYFARGEVKFLRRDDWAGAVADFDRAVALKPDHAQAWWNRAVCNERLNPVAAIADYTRFLELRPRHLNACINRGLMKEQTGDPAGAAEDLSRVIAARPEPGTVLWGPALLHQRRARLRLMIGDHAGALEDCAQCLEVEEEHSKSWDYARLMQHVLLRRSNRADPDLALTVKRWREAGNDCWTMKIGEFLTGRMTEKAFLVAGETAPDVDQPEATADAYYFAGMLRLCRGDNAGARPLFQKSAAAGSDSTLFDIPSMAAAELKRLPP